MRHHIVTALAARGRAVIGLSGGSSPKDIYTALAAETGIDWSCVWLFLVDDRYISADHKDSNQKLLTDAGLCAPLLPADHIVLPNTALPLAECIDDYNTRVARLLSE